METSRRLPGALRRIRLEIVREPGQPAGNGRIGYVFVAPLDEDHRIDARLWRAHRADCCVVRFRPREEDVGHLFHKPGGAWAFRYDVRGGANEETGFRSGNESFVTGEYVSVREADAMHRFKVISVEQV